MQKRIQRFRRVAEDVLIRSPDGRGSESKFWVNVGKAICAFLLLFHAGSVINHPDFTLILLAFLILPDLAKKVIAMRFGGSSSETTTMTTASQKTTEVKV